jgi:hypothetical protein
MYVAPSDDFVFEFYAYSDDTYYKIGRATTKLNVFTSGSFKNFNV